MTKIIANSVSFHSRGDEAMFFTGLQTSPAFKHVRGIGLDLVITLDCRKFTRRSAIDFVALFVRWDVNLASLKPICKGRFADWIGCYDTYWLDLILERAQDDPDPPISPAAT